MIFLDERRKSDTMFEPHKILFYESLAESLKNYKKPGSSKLDLLIELLENKKPKNETNFTELYNMLQFDVYIMATKGNQENH